MAQQMQGGASPMAQGAASPMAQQQINDALLRPVPASPLPSGAATPMQQQQQVQGAQQLPTGSTPNAKRPLDRAAYIAMDQGAARVMTAEDLSQGFVNLVRLQARDEGFTKNVAECVHYNSELLDAVIGRVNAIEAATKLTQSVVEDQGMKMGLCRAEVDAITEDTKVGLDKVIEMPESDILLIQGPVSILSFILSVHHSLERVRPTPSLASSRCF